MTSTALAPNRRSTRLPLIVAAAVAAVALLAVGVGLLAFHANESRPLPSFPALADNPDPSLEGTVAYYASATGCVRLVAASGAASRNLWCLPVEGPSVWVTEGKPVGPQLVWRSDGRLEVTMFRMKVTGDTKSAPPLTAGWQKLIDPATGAIEDVAQADLPTTPTTTTEPTTTPAGEVIAVKTDAMTGKVTVTLTSASGSRTLLAVHGPGEYSYQFGPVFWAPNWKWIAAADDGRILVITPTDPAVTRVLVTGAGGGAGGGTAGPTFAVTTAALVPVDAAA